MRPLKVPSDIKSHAVPKDQLLKEIGIMRTVFEKQSSAMPEVSVVIPAYNESRNILATLSSLAASSTMKAFEVIVVDNNSSDDTARLVALSGAICINELKQGITPARNRGLAASRGKYLLNADADTIYPPQWIDLMIAPLETGRAAMTYGSHAFLPDADRRNLVHLAYEYIGDIKKWINRRCREEAVNVYGFNSAFLRREGLAVDSFNHPPGTNEDGWMAVKLRKYTGRPLVCQTDPAARVWTSNRRLMADGGMLRATLKRLHFLRT